MPASESPQIIGRYRTVAALPDRGFGREYLATASGRGAANSETPVRLVVFDSIKAPLQKRLKRRVREATRLRDGALERVLELTDVRGAPVVALEGVFGVTLRELMDREPALEPAVLAAIVARAARGLHALHEHRDRKHAALEWVHGHLSPGSVLVAWSGRVLVTQIAFADVAAARVPPHFQYFSPEQARAVALDRRSDVFSLGLVSYEALTRTRPFSTRSLPDYMLSVLADVPRDPSELVPGLSPELASIVMRCLERDPARRFADCAELATALLACAGVAAAAEESNLSAILAGNYPAERVAADELLERAARARSDRSAAAHPARGWGRRPLIALLVLAIALAIVAWAVTSRGAPTCWHRKRSYVT